MTGYLVAILTFVSLAVLIGFALNVQWGQAGMINFGLAGFYGVGAYTGSSDWTNQSDQGAFNAKGIPFVYFGEEDHPDYHRVGDSADRLMPSFYAAAVRAVADFLFRFDANPVPR